MGKFFENLWENPYSSLWIVILGGVIAGIGAYRQAIKEVLDAKAAAKTEQKRSDEYRDLLNKNLGIQDSTNKIIKKSDETISSLVKLQKTQNETIENLRLQLIKSDAIMQKQIATVNYITGTDQIPKLIFAVSSVRGSSTDYKIAILIQNNEEYPLKEVQMMVIPTPAKRFPIEPRGRKTDNELILEKEAKLNSYKYSNPVDIEGHNWKVLYDNQKEFDSMIDRTTYEVYVRWSKGLYSFHGTLDIQNFRPTMVFPKFISSDPRIKSIDDLTYFEFKDGFSKDIIEEILRVKRETEVGEKVRKELEKRDEEQRNKPKP